MNYSITFEQKHDLSIAYKNAINQIVHLETLLQASSKKEEYQKSSLYILDQLENSVKTIDNAEAVVESVF